MELFVVSSHYQLLNACLIVKEFNIEADLLIIRDSISKSCDLTILCEKRIFKSVYIWTDLLEKMTDENVQHPVQKIFRSFKSAITYFQVKKIWNSIPNRYESYSNINITYVDSITLSVFSWFKRSGASLSLFEDGTYTYGCLSIKKSIVRRIVERVLFRCTGIDECVKIYVKHPNLVDNKMHSDVVLEKFKGQIDDDALETMILPLYGTKKEAMQKFKVKTLIFDQNLELIELKKLQKDIALKALNVFGEDNVLVKLHPSSRDQNYGNRLNTFNEKIPFEIIMAYEKMDEKVLISIFSTACMTPKFDYNQEPYVIFTYKLFGNQFLISEQYLKQIDQLRKSYRNSDRIFVPTSLDEYKSILNVIKEKIE